MTKKELHQLINESIQLITEKKLCPKGKAYYNRRIKAGEKPSAYLSGRAVKVCKGLMEGDEEMVHCENCGWEWKLADGGEDPFICHNILPSGRICNHNNIENYDMNESLHDWFKKEDWVRIDTQGNITGPCGTMKKGKATTRCLPRAKAKSLSKKDRAATSRKKANADRKGDLVVPNTNKAKVRLEIITPLMKEDINLQTIKNEDKGIQKAAGELNLPYDTIYTSFIKGKEVTLNDDMWSRLENTNSYNVNSEGEAIELTRQYNENYQNVSFTEKPQHALILQYSPNKFYLIGGDDSLIFARVKGINPQVILATIEPTAKWAYQNVTGGIDLKEAMNGALPKSEEGKIIVKDSIDVFKSLLSYCEALGNTPIMYRAVGGKLKSMVVRVTNADMSKIKGNTLTQVTTLKELGIKNPTFASFDSSNLFFFGTAYTIIPKPSYKIYQSPEIFDLGVYSNPDIYKTDGNLRSQIGTYTDEQQVQRGKDAAKTYQQITSPLPGKERSEIIIDISEYYLVSIADMINISGKFSGFEIKDTNKIKTYSQLSSILKAIIKYWTFVANRSANKVNENEEIDEYDVESEDDYEGFIMFMKEYARQLNESKLTEAEYHGRKVQLGKIMQGDIKKFKVYVKNNKGKVVKVNFGFGGKSAKGKRMVIKAKNPKRRAAYRARHNCSNPGPRWRANYWSCKKW